MSAIAESGPGRGAALLLAASIAVNLWLTWRLARARDAWTEARQAAPGERMPAFAVRTKAHGWKALSWRPGRTVIYFSCVRCKWYAWNELSWRALARGLCAEGGIEIYRFDHELALAASDCVELVTGDEASLAFQLFKVNSTPRTVVIGQEGVVLKAWPGLYAARTRLEKD